MLNKEKYAKEIIDIATEFGDVGLVDGNPVPCKNIACGVCEFSHPQGCTVGRYEWANSEYREPRYEVDWTKVPVDTPIIVWEDDVQRKCNRYFAKCEKGKVYAYNYGATSWTSNGGKQSWRCAELAEPNPKYMKEVE